MPETGTDKDRDDYQSVKESIENIKDPVSDNDSESGEDTKISEKKRHLVVVKGKFKRRFPRAFPSYTLGSHVQGNKVNNREENQPLAINARINDDKDEEKCYYEKDITRKFMKRSSSSKESIDPSHYPLEQITDAEYGRPLDHSDMNNRLYLKQQQKRKFTLLISLVSLLFIIAGIVGSTIRHKRSGNVLEPSTTFSESEILENICNITNILTQSGLAKCEEACDSSSIRLIRPKPCEVLDSDKIDVESISNSTGMNSHSSIMRAPNDLGKLCSDASIASQSGFVQCQSACLAAQCCFISTFVRQEVTSTNNPSIMQPCSELHRYTCASYTPCLSIQGIGSPIDLVNQKCAINNIRYPEGKQDCIFFCEPRNCCFTKSQGKNCYKDKKLWCDEYLSCKNLDSTSFQDSTIIEDHSTQSPHLVNELCTSRNIRNISGREDCESVCKQRSCCFSKEENCAINNKIWCDEFQACTILSNQPSTQISGGSNSGADICPVDCTAWYDGCNTCRCEGIDNAVGCTEMACQKLGLPRCLQFHYEEVKNISGTSKCYNFSSLSSVDAQFCKASCEIGICCFFDKEHCKGLKIDCAQYQYCNQPGLLAPPHDIGTHLIPTVDKNDTVSSGSKNLPLIEGPIGGENGLQSGPSVAQVEATCLHGAKLNKCYKLCSAFLCCFLDTYNAFSCHTSKICAKYSACSKVLGSGTPDEFGTKTTKANSDEGTYPADTMCSIDNLSMKGGLRLCQTLCSKHMCCFGGDEACPYRHDCPVYQACGILADKDRIVKRSDGTITFNFDSICSLDSLATIGGQNACKKICDPYACCDTGGCKNRRVQSFCDKIGACQNFYRKNDEPIKPTMLVTSSECTQLCPKDTPDWQNNAKCDIKKIGSCSCTYQEDSYCFLRCSEPGTWVMACEGGKPLINVNDSAPPPVELKSFCSLELITSQDPFAITKCLEICKVAECCKEQTCLEKLSFCDSYMSCYSVWEVNELNKKIEGTNPTGDP